CGVVEVRAHALGLRLNQIDNRSRRLASRGSFEGGHQGLRGLAYRCVGGKQSGGEGCDGKRQAGDRPGAARPPQNHLRVDMWAAARMRRLVGGEIRSEVTWQWASGNEGARRLPLVLVLCPPFRVPLGLILLFWLDQARGQGGERGALLGEGAGRRAVAWASAGAGGGLPISCPIPEAAPTPSLALPCGSIAKG